MVSPAVALESEKRESIDKKELASPTLASSTKGQDIEKHAEADGPHVHYSFPRRVGRYVKSYPCTQSSSLTDMRFSSDP